SSSRTREQPGAWDSPTATFDQFICYNRTHAESIRFDYDEAFRFVWENRKPLKLNEQARTRVLSVLPCVRKAPDGFQLKETVVQYYQQLKIAARELETYGIRKPAAMPGDTVVTLYGGNTLIFDEYGRLKYNIGSSILNPGRDDKQNQQSYRLA